MRISDWSSDVCSSDLFGGQSTITRSYSSMRDFTARLRSSIGLAEKNLPAGADASLSCTSMRSRLEGSRSIVVAERTSETPFWSVAVISNFRWSGRSEEHTSELQSLMRISYAVFCLKKNKNCTEAAQQQ